MDLLEVSFSHVELMRIFFHLETLFAAVRMDLSRRGKKQHNSECFGTFEVKIIAGKRISLVSLPL